MNKITPSQKIFAGFAASAFILITVATYSFKTSEKFIETNEWVRHSYDVLFEFDQILAATIDQETGERGFLITDNEAYLEPYYEGITKANAHLKRAKELTIDNPAQQKNIDELAIAVHKAMEYRQGLIEMKKKDEQTAILKTFNATNGKQLQEEVRRIIDESKELENILLQKRRAAVQVDARKFNLVFTLLLAFITFILITVYIITSKNFRYLKKAEEKANNNNWLLTGTSELNEKIRGEQEVEVLGQTIIDQLCSYLKAQIGVIYLYKNNQLSLCASYAYDFSKLNSQTVKLGEGLVGQAAQEKKMITFTDVPDNYIKINSGLGNIVPKCIIALPLLQNDMLQGVIEIGLTRTLSDLQIQFINTVSESIAIAITAATNRKLLNESFTQIQLQKTDIEKVSLELNQQVSCLNNAAIVSITDANGNISYVNDTFCKISKYSKEELIGKNHRILKSERQPNGLFIGMWAAISKGKIWNGEIINKAKDGTYYWVDTTITPFKDLNGNIEKYVAIRFDITERKEQSEKLKTLLEQTQQQAEELEAQQEELRQTNEELLEKTTLLEKSEAELRTQQEELQQANEELEEQTSMLEEQKGSLENAKMDIETKARELEGVSKYKSEFLANMSHELRTPLNSILILSQLLSENKGKSLGAKEIEFSKNIYNSGTDLLNLINEILDLSKVEAGKMELDIHETPFTEIHSEITSMFSEVAKNKSIRFKVQLDKELKNTTITTDKQRLEQILRNLLSNAFKFTDKGGEIVLSINKIKREVSFNNNKLNNIRGLLAFSVSEDRKSVV